MEKRKSLLGMNLSEIEEWVQLIGEKRYRAEQIYRGIYAAGKTNFSEMTDLSKPLRDKLGQIATIGSLRLMNQSVSPHTSTAKFLFQLTDGECIESVLIVEKNRKTVCVSTQVGCALRCTFCATGKMGFLRNLSSGEIVEQVWFIRNFFDRDVSNVVFMGIGEPFLNYDFSVRAADLLSDDGGMAIAARKITISTSGILPRIKQYADEGHKFKLAVSIHSMDTDLRTRLMPINKKYPLAELVEGMKYYTQRTKKRITIEYVLLEGENDSAEDAHRLVELAKMIPCKINILYYNPTDGPHRTPTEEQIQPFIKLITKAPAPVTIRRSKGNDINAACGQLYINHQEALHSKITHKPPVRIDISGG